MTAFDAVIAKARAIPIEGEVTRRGLKLARVGAELVGGCPVCGGKDRFAINPKKGKWNCRGCQKGGDIISLVMHVDDIEFKEAIEHLTADKVTPETGNGAAKPKLIRTLGPYEFCAPATGAVAYRKTREEYSDGSKKFFFDPPGRDPPLLYGGEQLADLGEGRRVWIVEGEKKVDRLRQLGEVAISGDSGCCSKWLPAHADLLRGLPIIFWPDSDNQGEKYIARAAAALRRSVESLSVVRPFGRPNGAKGRDVCDWEGDAEAFAALVASATPYEPMPEATSKLDKPIGNGADAQYNEERLWAPDSRHSESFARENSTAITTTNCTFAQFGRRRRRALARHFAAAWRWPLWGWPFPRLGVL